MKEFPIIETESLVLRKLEITDFENHFDYVTDEMVAKQFLFHHTKESCKKRLEEIIESYNRENKPFIWGIAFKENNELIGIISADTVSFNNKNFSIACGIIEKYRKKGYGFQATVALVDYFFKHLDMYRVQLGHRVGNMGTQRIVEKMGAKFEGIARSSKFYEGEFKDRKIYSILKPEWEEFIKKQKGE